MYTEYFGFTKNPFNLAADLTCLFLDDNRRELVDGIVQNIQTDTKPIVVTGASRIGKTFLIHYLQSKLPSQFECLYLAENSITYSARIHELMSTLPNRMETETKPLIILDNAHEIPLDALKLLLVYALGKCSFQLILVGLLEVTNKLYKIDLDFFSDKKSHIYRLNGLSDPQVNAYITFRLTHVAHYENSLGTLFSVGALRIIADLSNGLPHSINLLCGAALLITSFENKTQVSTEIALEAALSCMLPAEITEDKILASFTNLQNNQSQSPDYKLNRLTHSRRHEKQRMKNWKRLTNIQDQLPVPLTVVPPSKGAQVKANRRRLINRVAIVGFSLYFLISLQQIDDRNPDIQEKMLNSPAQFQSTGDEQHEVTLLSIKDEPVNQIGNSKPNPSNNLISHDPLTVAGTKTVDKTVVTVAKVELNTLSGKLGENPVSPLQTPQQALINFLAKSVARSTLYSETMPMFEQVSAKHIPE